MEPGDDSVGLSDYESIAIYKAIPVTKSVNQEDGEVAEGAGEPIEGEENIKNLFSEEEWMNINEELRNEFEKQVEKYDSWKGVQDVDDAVDDIRNSRGRQEMENYIQEEVLKLHKTTLLESRKLQIEKELKLLE